MEVVRTTLPDVWLLKPRIFGDPRGFFFESYNQRTLTNLGIPHNFVQDNHARSGRNVLRGLHYQIRQPQGKLVRCVVGEIFDVAVDLRRSSATFGRWVGVRLSADSHDMLWVPAGFAHGYLVLSETAEVLYKTTDYYAPEHERCLLWSDPALAIDWPLAASPILSSKDQAGRRLSEVEAYP